MPIETVELTHIYNQNTAFQKTALKSVNLKIDDGAFVGLIGQTGSGKSTLIQHFNGLLKPSSGQVLLDGKDINADKTRLRDVRRHVGLVFQYPEHQLFEVSVAKDVAFGPGNLGLSKSEIDDRVRESLAVVGISEDLFDVSPFDLSGGQRRRVAIAGVLAMRPKVLVLDEPTAGLDPESRSALLKNIKAMHDKLSIAIILVSHSMDEIAEYADDVIVMAGGAITARGTPAEIFAREDLTGIGLDVPQMCEVVKRLNANGFNIPPGVFTPEETARYVLKAFQKDSRL